MLRRVRNELPLALAAVIVLVASCARRFEPSYKPDFNCFRHLDSIPIIVVAKIGPNAITVVGRPFTVRLLPGDPLALFEARARIENALKGGAPVGDTNFFYIGQAIPHGPPGIGFYGSRLFREILLLRREHGQLRTATDITADAQAAVYSGAHPGFKPRVGEPVPEQMIDLLLTPGVGATDLGIIQAIFDFKPAEISPDYTAKTLLKLASLPSPVIRTAACLQFRDLLAEKGPALSDQFGVSRSDLKRWQAQEEQNYPAKRWWGHGPLSYTVPKAPLPAGNLTGMNLCTNDKALGVPPLRPPSAATEFRPQPLPTVLH